MISKPLNALALTDIEELIADEVGEGKTIEYKSALPGSTSDDRKEFLADVTSFANTDGGDLLFGVAQQKGVPQPGPGMVIANPDDLRQRLENLLRDGVQPCVPDVQLKFISAGAAEHVLLIRIRKSWASPHRVVIGRHGHFYARNSAGKYQLDVDQLRSASFMVRRCRIASETSVVNERLRSVWEIRRSPSWRVHGMCCNYCRCRRLRATTSSR
jgi:predicted HTH transcriptional regulator